MTKDRTIRVLSARINRIISGKVFALIRWLGTVNKPLKK